MTVRLGCTALLVCCVFAVASPSPVPLDAETAPSDTLPNLAAQDYLPGSIPGMTRTNLTSPEPATRKAIPGLQGGVQSAWSPRGGTPLGIALVDLTLDIYQFDSAENARGFLTEVFPASGESSSETLVGLPVTITRETLDVGDLNHGEVTLDYRQGAVVIRIKAVREVKGEPVSMEEVAQDARGAFQAVVDHVRQ